MKKRKMIFWFRFLAVIDVLFSEKFELTTWNKNEIQKSKTKFHKTEILNSNL
jgi:hypothetical protein